MQSKDGLQNNKILTSLQKDILNVLFKEKWFEEKFYLTGGTALSAFHIKHRLSDDLAFFTHKDFESNFHLSIIKLFEKENIKAKIIQHTPDFIRINVNDELKLDFVRDIAARFGYPSKIHGIMVDDLHNIAVNKVLTILGRLDAKDYIDIYFLLSNYSFDIFGLMNDAKSKDGGMDEFVWARIIADCENFTVLPKMIKNLELPELKLFFKDLQDLILDHLKKDVQLK